MSFSTSNFVSNPGEQPCFRVVSPQDAQGGKYQSRVLPCRSVLAIQTCGLQNFCFRMYRGDGIAKEPPDIGFDDKIQDGNRVIGDVFMIQELFPAVTQATRKNGFSAQVVTNVAIEEGMLLVRIFSHKQGRQFINEGSTE